MWAGAAGGAGPAGTPQRPQAVARGGVRLVGFNPAHGHGECAATVIGTVRGPLRPGYSRSCVLSRLVSYRLTTQEQRP